MKILFTTFLTLGILSGYSQQQCKIITQEICEQYFKKEAGGDNSKLITIPVTLEYWSDKDKEANDFTLEFILDAGDAQAYNPRLNTKSKTIEAAGFSKKHNQKIVNVAVLIDTTDEFNPAGFKIQLKTGNGELSVRLGEKCDNKSKTTYDNAKPFWIELGTNIDLVDGVKPNNFTAGIFFQKYDHKWCGPDTTKHGRWASFAGAYEAKIVSTAGNMNYGTDTFVNNRSFIAGQPDTIQAFRYAGKSKQTQTIRNWSFFYSPAYRLGSGSYNDGNFHMFVSAWFELRYQEVETKTDHSTLTLIDSFRAPLNTVANYKLSDDTATKSNTYTHYLGIGIPIYTEGKDFSFFLNPVFGLTNQLTAAQYEELGDPKLGGKKGNSKWNPFYFVQFRLSDSEYGLTVTGEIRGLLRQQSPPQYTIALTKKFNLQKLINYGKD